MFVCPGEGCAQGSSLHAGVFNLSVDEAVKEAQEVHSLGSVCDSLRAFPTGRMKLPPVRGQMTALLQQAAARYETGESRI